MDVDVTTPGDAPAGDARGGSPGAGHEGGAAQAAAQRVVRGRVILDSEPQEDDGGGGDSSGGGTGIGSEEGAPGQEGDASQEPLRRAVLTEGDDLLAQVKAAQQPLRGRFCVLWEPAARGRGASAWWAVCGPLSNARPTPTSPPPTDATSLTSPLHAP